MIRVAGLAAIVGVGLLGATAASAQAPGSYRRSCTDINQDGPILEAACRDTRGNYVPTRIDLRRCGGGSVANSNGRLTCGGGGGGRRSFDEDSDDRRGPPDDRRGPPPYDPYGRPPGPRY